MRTAALTIGGLAALGAATFGIGTAAVGSTTHHAARPAAHPVRVSTYDDMAAPHVQPVPACPHAAPCATVTAAATTLRTPFADYRITVTRGVYDVYPSKTVVRCDTADGASHAPACAWLTGAHPFIVDESGYYYLTH